MVPTRWVDRCQGASARSRLTRISDKSGYDGSVAILCALVLLLIVGAQRGEYDLASAPFIGLGLVGCAFWLLRYDIARRTIRIAGPARFAASCIIAGHFWLGISGLLMLITPPATGAFAYDAVIHTLAIGFVFSMVFGHASIILPAITGLRIAYTPLAYLPLALLHISLAIRVGSDLFEWTQPRSFSGGLTALALIGYAITLVLKSHGAAQARSGV